MKLSEFFKTAAHDFVKGAAKVLEVLQQAQVAEPEIKAVTDLVAPRAAKYEDLAFRCLGHVAGAVADSAGAVSSGGLNLAADAELIADIKAFIADVHPGKPAAAAAPAPAPAASSSPATSWPGSAK